MADIAELDTTRKEWGKDQVAVGLAPTGFANKSSESALSIYPIAIGNCKEKRSNLKQLLRNLNHQKNVIKKHEFLWMAKSTTFVSQ